MNEDTKQLVIVFGGIAAVACVLIAAALIGTISGHLRDRAAFEAGYVQTSLPGQSNVYWTKPEHKDQ